MTVTASRLGQAPITLDWSNLTRVPVESAPRTGAGPASWAAGPERESFSQAWLKLQKRFDSGEVGFYHSPSRPEISQVEESVKLANELLESKRFTDCLFLGIGGSALGPISLLSALEDRTSGKIRFHFMENPDALEWRGKVAELDPDKTLVCVVTKSGTTFETVAQFLIALQWLGRERWHTHVVAITDPEKGDLQAFANRHEIPTLRIAPSLGGRFSVFSPVGLFPATLAGLDARRFLQGAQQVHDYVEKTAVERNPLFVIGAELLRHFAQRPTHVIMPYSSRLRWVGDWFVQLWGESLGKDGKGFTPVAALGATDQHSLLQLLRDGPDDKVTLFVTLDQVDDPVAIPKLGLEPGQSRNYPAFAILEGHTLHGLLGVEYRATSLVLTKRNRPHLTLQLDRLDERTMGALYFAFSVLVSFTGTLWGVNPFDQPGVEEGKVYIRQSLSDEIPGRKEEIDGNSPVARLRRERNTVYDPGSDGEGH